MEEFIRMANDSGKDKKKINLINVLYNLLKELSDVDSEKDIYSIILKAAEEAIPAAEAGSILIKKGELLEYAASFGLDYDFLKMVKFKEEETLLFQKTEGKMNKAIIIENFTQENQKNLSEKNRKFLEKAGAFRILSSISVPMFSNQTLVGGLHLDSTKPQAFKEEDQEILEIFAFELARIMKLVESIEEKNYLLRYDDMTGIFNRRYCTELLKKRIEDKDPFTLVSLDLNNLKVINDSLGHEMGDQYIRHFVQVMKKALDDQVIFSRYGGDEFIMIFPGLDKEKVENLLQKVQGIFLQEGRFDEGVSFGLSFSYGIALFPEENDNYDGIIRLADHRMYQCKKKYKESLKNSAFFQ